MPTTLPVKDLDHLLQEKLGPDLKIESAKWKPLTAPGENYGSLIYSVNVTVTRSNTTQILDLVVKLPPPSDYLLDLFNSPFSFWKELVFYKEIAPRLIQVQLENSIENNELIRLTPQYYGGRLGLKNANVFDCQATVVLENLIPEGYTVQDRLLGLDLEHTTLVVGELAKLHALVIGLKVKYPEYFRDTILPALVHAANDTAFEAMKDMLRQAHAVYKKLPEAKPYMDRIDRTLKHDYEVDYRHLKPLEPWGTMVHNDFWSNNMLFKYNSEQKPVSIKIIDFQLGFYNSGVMDLIFFLLTSAQEAVLDDYLDDMFDHYYTVFIKCLTSLKVDITEFTRKGFDAEVHKCAPLKFGQCIMMVNVIKAPRGALENIEDMNEDTGFASIGNGAEAQKKLLHILHIFSKKKWLVI